MPTTAAAHGGGGERGAYAGAFDWDLLLECLGGIRDGREVQIPVYDYKTHSRREETEAVGRPDVVLLEGILVLFDARVRAMLDMMLFVDEDSDTRLSRRGARAGPADAAAGPAPGSRLLTCSCR